MFFSKTPKSNTPLCAKCGLAKSARNPRANVVGEGKKGILILHKSPSKRQDATNDPYSGEGTKFLEKELSELGLDLREDCWMLPAIGCPTTQKAQQLNKAVNFCSPRLSSIIKKLKPKAIWCMGNTAIYSLFGKEVKGLTVEKCRFFAIPSFEYNCYVHSFFHPLAAMENEGDPFWYSVRKRDFQKALLELDKPMIPKINYEDQVECVADHGRICQLLDEVLEKNPEIFIRDYEGTGLDLFIEGSRMETASFAVIQDMANYDILKQKAYAFPIDRKGMFTEEERNNIVSRWVRILKRKRIAKCAHNVALERTWEKHHLGCETSENDHDSMVAAHLEVPEKGTAGLKWWAFVLNGCMGYGDEAKKYFESKYENGLNKIDKFPLQKLLLYNGLDSLFNAYLYAHQHEYFRLAKKRRFGERDALHWYNKIAVAMAELHLQGMPIDVDYLMKQRAELSAKLDEVNAKLMQTPEVRRFAERENREPNMGSDDDLRLVFFTYGGNEVVKTTDSGMISVDKEVMHALEGECASLLLQRREIEKVIGTYIDGFMKLQHNGRLHPYINMHIARTLRSSCKSPNLQNVSARNKMQKTAVRGGIVSEGEDYYFFEVDLSGVEIQQNACICGDPYLLELLTDNTVDMHSLFVKHCYDMVDSQVTKAIRNPHKMNWTFAQAYGSNYYACARKTFEWMNAEQPLTGDDITLREHLAIRGIKSERDFIDYWKDKEESYWAKLKVWRAWQQNCFDEYLNTGGVTTPSGYVRRGILNKNKVLNTPAQNGGAFCDLTALVQLLIELKHRKLRSKLHMQVHDSIVGSMHKDEVQETCDLIMWALTVWTKDTHKYLKVPLGAEIEMSPKPGMSWLDKVVWEKIDGVWQPKDK